MYCLYFTANHYTLVPKCIQHCMGVKREMECNNTLSIMVENNWYMLFCIRWFCHIVVLTGMWIHPKAVVIDNHLPRHHSFHPMFPTDHCRLVSIFRRKEMALRARIYAYNRHLSFDVAFSCSTLTHCGVCHLSVWRLKWELSYVHRSVWRWKWFFCQSNYVLQRLRLGRTSDTVFRREIDSRRQWGYGTCYGGIVSPLRRSVGCGHQRVIGRIALYLCRQYGHSVSQFLYDVWDGGMRVIPAFGEVVLHTSEHLNFTQSEVVATLQLDNNIAAFGCTVKGPGLTSSQGTITVSTGIIASNSRGCSVRVYICSANLEVCKTVSCKINQYEGLYYQIHLDISSCPKLNYLPVHSFIVFKWYELQYIVSCRWSTVHMVIKWCCCYI